MEPLANWWCVVSLSWRWKSPSTCKAKSSSVWRKRAGSASNCECLGRRRSAEIKLGAAQRRNDHRAAVELGARLDQRLAAPPPYGAHCAVASVFDMLRAVMY